MKRNTNPVWELIGHDPLFRVELSAIERQSSSDDELVDSLIGFYARIERMMKLTAEIIEEDAMSMQ